MNDHRAEMNALTKENIQISVWEIALTVSISYGSEFALSTMILSMQCICGFDHNQNFLRRWDKKACELQFALKKRGDNFEKYTLHLSQIVVHKAFNKFNVLSSGVHQNNTRQFFLV
jgi:hypothetical protein